MAKIIHEKDKCIGCGACVAVCPDCWTMSEDGKSELKDSVESNGNYEKEVSDVGCTKEAADACPVQCILIK